MSEPYTVTAWDIYNFATHKATEDKPNEIKWRELAEQIKTLAREFYVREKEGVI